MSLLQEGNKKAVKILILGDCYVGKTSILEEYVQTLYKSNEKAENLEKNQTVPVDLEATFILDNDDDADDYKPTTLEVFKSEFDINLEPHNLYVTELSGNNDDKRLIDMRHFFYLLQKNIDAFVICFSLIDYDSFKNVSSKWIPEIKSQNHYKDVPILLVGCKHDLKKQAKLQRQSSGTSRISSRHRYEASLNDSIDSDFNESRSEYYSPKIGRKNLRLEKIDFMSNDELSPSYVSSNLCLYEINRYKQINLNQFIELLNVLNQTKNNESGENAAYSKMSLLSKSHLSRTSNRDNNNNFLDILDGLTMNDSISAEPVFVRRSDAMQLKKNIQAKDYLVCSIKDATSIKKVFNAAINIAANFSKQNKTDTKSQEENRIVRDVEKIVQEGEEIMRDEKISKKWITFPELPKPIEIKQQPIDNADVKVCDKEKKKNFFSNIFNRKNFKLKCISCTRSDTLASINSKVE